MKIKGRIIPAFVFYQQKVAVNDCGYLNKFSCEKIRHGMKLTGKVVVDKFSG